MRGGPAEEKNEKVLIIEDTLGTALSSEKALEGQGFNLKVTSKPDEALAIISRWNPSVILLHLDGGGKNTKTILRDIRQVNTSPRPSIIIVPEAQEKEELIGAIKDGADDIVSQPVTVDKLFERVQEQLRLKKAVPKEFNTGEENLQSLLEITAAITSSLNPSEVFQTIVARVAKATGAERCSIVLVTKDDGYVLASHDNLALKDRRIDLKKYPEIIEAIKRKDPMIVEDIATDPLMNSVKASVAGLEGKSLLLVPIVFNDRVLGTLFLRTKKETGCFTREEVNFCRIVANSAFHAIKNARIFQRLTEENSYLQEAAIRDHLTGLYNHNHFYVHLDEDFIRASRYRTPLSLIMMDIDYFKEINDTHGHRAGDMVLKDLARLIKKTVRKADIVARYGGEEFAIIMTNTDITGALDEAERLRKKIESHVFKPFPDIKVTISLGVATYPNTHITDISSGGDLVTRADEALYRAKHKGRNRTVVDDGGKIFGDD